MTTANALPRTIAEWKQHYDRKVAICENIAGECEETAGFYDEGTEEREFFEQLAKAKRKDAEPWKVKADKMQTGLDCIEAGFPPRSVLDGDIEAADALRCEALLGIGTGHVVQLKAA